MMVFFNINTGLDHFQGHCGTDVMQLVGGGNREITFFVTRSVAQIGFGVIAGIPDTFLRINFVKTAVAVGIESDTIENEEFQFRSPETGIGDAGRFEVSLGLFGDITGGAVIVFAVRGVFDVADEAQG